MQTWHQVTVKNTCDEREKRLEEKSLNLSLSSALPLSAWLALSFPPPFDCFFVGDADAGREPGALRLTWLLKDDLPPFFCCCTPLSGITSTTFAVRL